MAFASVTPTAPWTTGVSGSGTWAQLVTYINNPAIISQVNNVYTITGMIEIRATMTALLNSTVICKGGGGYCVYALGSVTFGRTLTTNAGQTLAVDGCLLIDDTDAFARGVDNYTNVNCWVRSSGYLYLYATTYICRTTTRSDTDFASNSYVTIRDCRFHTQAGVIQYDHYAGNLNINGLTSTHASDISGSILELLTTSVVTQLTNMTPYLNNTLTRQCTLWCANVTLSQWGGDNFAPWNLSAYFRFDDPKVMALTEVDRYGTAGSSHAERRTTDILCLATTGSVAATVTIMNNVDELDGEGVANATTGIFTTKLKRLVWPGGSTTTATGYTRTPHVITARKWGYKTFSNSFSANPSYYGQAKLNVLAQMILDSNITLTSAQSAAISGVTIQKHGKAITWNGKPFSITVTANSSLTLSQVYHSIAYQCSELNNLLPVAAARVTVTGHNYYTPWLGSTGDADLTLVVVHTTRTNNTIWGNQVVGSIGTGTAGLSCYCSVTSGMVFQSYTNTLFPTANYTGAQSQFVNSDGGEQLIISVGRYDSVAKTVNVWSNNKYYGQETQTINRGVLAQFFRVLGQGNVTTWEVDQHNFCESLAYDRRITDVEVQQITAYLANKWHHTGVGNISPTGNNAITSANFPTNAAGNDWTPADYATGQGPLNWVSMASPSDYTLSGSNITAFKDKVTGINIVNSTINSVNAQVVNNYRKWVPHQFFDTATSTNRGIYCDGRYRGVRVIDENGNPFPGVVSMMADDGTLYYEPIFTTVSGLVVGTEVRVYKVSDDTELAGIESTTGTTFTFSYTYTADIPVYIVIFALSKQPIRFNATLGNSNTTIPIQQIVDRVYSNL